MKNLIYVGAAAVIFCLFVFWGGYLLPNVGSERACEALVEEAMEQLSSIRDLEVKTRIRQLISEADFQGRAGRKRACMSAITLAFKLMPVN